MKKIIRVKVDHISPSSLPSTLSGVKDFISGLIEEYGPDALFDWDPYHWEAYDNNPSPRYDVIIRREETDEEYAKRVQEENIRKEEQDKREKAEFERLSKKFGDNNGQ